MDRQSELLSSFEKGKEEGKTEVARGMKEKNFPVEIITEITGLTAEQVASL